MSEHKTIPRNHLASLRERSRLTQKEVAILVGKDHTTVNKHERHLRGLTPEDIEAYSKLYKVSSFELFVTPADLASGVEIDLDHDQQRA